MKNNLISKLKKGVYMGLTAGTLSLASYLGSSCSEGPTQPKINYPPVASLSVSPLSGVAPMADTVKYSCTDKDNDLQTTQLYMNGNPISASTSLDTVLTLSQNSSFKAKCIDTQGNTDSIGPISVQVLQPSISQTATLSDSTGILYNANLTNVSQATRQMLRNDSLIKTDTITGPTFSQTFSNQKKGDYSFVLRTNNPLVNPNTTKVSVPNYLPTVNLSGVQASFNEGDSISAALPKPTDKNPEDNPVPYSFAKSLDGKVTASIVNDTLKVRSVGDSTGIYKIMIGFGTQEGGIDSSVVSDTIYDLPDISGELQSNETQSGIQGTLRAYTISGTYPNADTTAIPAFTSDSAGDILTDSSGNFSFRLTKRSSDLTDILLQARQGKPGDYQGYVRSILLSAKDTNNLLIRAVPYPSFTSPDSFVTFMHMLSDSLLNLGFPNTRFDFTGQYNGIGLQGIEILQSFAGNLLGPQQDSIKKMILDTSNISGIIGQYKIDSNKIILGNKGHYNIDSNAVINGQKFTRVIPNRGWIIVVPDSNILTQFGYTGMTDDFGIGTEYGAVVYLAPEKSDSLYFYNGVVAFEFGHVFTGGGEPVMFPDYNIMDPSSKLQEEGPANKKAGKLIYELTFMILTPSPHVDYFSNTLSMNFK